MDKRIVYTRHSDGGVSICCPSDDAIAWMGCGGFWNDRPRGFMDVQIDRQVVNHKISHDLARRYCHAMQFGGCTTAEALEIIRDRDCAPHGTAIELWDVSELLADRWFRDAWKRSHNGGPISVDIKLARPVQFKRIAGAFETENKRRRDDLECFDPPIELDWAAIKNRILRTRDEDELRSIWPKELAR